MSEMNEESTPKKPRGRPRKNPLPEGAEAAPKKPRGRPRKNPDDGEQKRTPGVSLPASLLATTVPNGTVFSPGANKPAVPKDDLEPAPMLPPRTTETFSFAPEAVDTLADGDEERNFRNDRWNNNRRNDRNNHHQNRNNRNNNRNFGRNNRYDRQGLSPEQEAQRQAQRETAEAEAAERMKLAQALNLAELQQMEIPELKELAAHYRMEELGAVTRPEIIFQILKANAKCSGTATATGVVQVLHEGHAFLRSRHNHFQHSADDVYISSTFVRRFALRTGDTLEGELRTPRDKERYFALGQVLSLNGGAPESAHAAIPFEDLRPVYPDERLVLETQQPETGTEMRILDLIAPLGKGQRALIAAPPQSGASTLFQQIIASISENNPETKVILLLIGERPEDVTEMERLTRAEVFAAPFGAGPEYAIQLVSMVFQMAKRQVEDGKDIVILLDSITQLAQAHAALDGAAACQQIKQLFGTARNIQGNGSLTLLATAQVDTGNAADEATFSALQYAANMVVRLDREVAKKGIFPALRIMASGTRKADLLMHQDEINRTDALRRQLADLPPPEAMEQLLAQVKKTRNNLEFLMTMQG